MISYVCRVLNWMMNGSLIKKIIVCMLIPCGWMYISVLMLNRELHAKKKEER